MENVTNSTNSIENTEKYINNVYDNLSYYDLYGSSIFAFVIITILIIFVLMFGQIMKNRGEIAADWENQKCNPKYLPFAGYISRPEGKTAFEYTSENFQYCIQDVLLGISEKSLQPFNYMITAITAIFQQFAESLQNIRQTLSSIRSNMQHISENIFTRILNVVIPLQTLFIALNDTFNKIQGIFTAALYTALGSYYTLQSLMGAIMELIIKMLVMLAIMIAGLWIMPATWPMASTMSAAFLAVSIPLAVIASFMSKTLHVKSGKIPKLRCFDENVEFNLMDKGLTSIKNVNIGDELSDGSKITAKIIITAEDLKMYDLNGIIVSESHIIKYKDKWIPVCQHPNAQEINYYKNYLYCINTTNKVFELNGILFTDWDEVCEDNLKYILEYQKNNIIQFGFKGTDKVKMQHSNDECISNIKVGDVLFGNNIVYGIVEMGNNDLDNEKIYNLLVSKNYFLLNNKITNDYDFMILDILQKKNDNKNNNENENKK